MRLPEQNAVEGLLTLELKPAGNRNGKSDQDIVIAHNVGSPLTLRCAWRTYLATKRQLSRHRDTLANDYRPESGLLDGRT